MAKKLISMISVYGKSTERVVHETWVAFVHFQAVELGLAQCKQCGEYKGKTVNDGEKQEEKEND